MTNLFEVVKKKKDLTVHSLLFDILDPSVGPHFSGTMSWVQVNTLYKVEISHPRSWTTL
jgi:hypothetical protein